MNKVYMVIIHFDNGYYTYEERSTYIEVDKLFSTREKANAYVINWKVPEEEHFYPIYEDETERLTTKFRFFKDCCRVVHVEGTSNPGYYGLEIQEMGVDEDTPTETIDLNELRMEMEEGWT